ncbi:MAG: sensor histidine kinase, partial [Lachnospiraceae bacterium]|nr:sensor histidine kinase [Lachnospiraceae bacterium]
MNWWKKLRLSYYKLSIRVKLIICVVLAAMLPVFSIAVMFSGRLYDMIAADTIRAQQVASDNIAPQIEASLSSIVECFQDIRSQEYYRRLFETPLKKMPSSLEDAREAAAFAAYVENLVAKSPLTAVRFYLDLPDSESSFFNRESSHDLFLPESASQGTYWHGIFQSGNYPSLHCPPMYLGPQEAARYGDCAYICRSYLNYDNALYPCYIALYYPSDIYTEVLSANLSLPDCVSYIINERDAVIASTDDSLSGIYRLSYSDIQESLMSSNSFIERNVLDNLVYAAFHSIRDADWLMVTVIPRAPLLQITHRTVYSFIAVCAVCILAAICIGLTLTRSLTVRISSLIGQMTKIRTGTPVPMPEPEIQDEVGELISTYNYMTRTMEQL